jgi:kynurenine formamidase
MTNWVYPLRKYDQFALLIGRGRFRFIALPLKICERAGSPVRTMAVFEE